MTSSALSIGDDGLHALGIEEVEPWICEDNFENRRILRKAKLMWDQVTTDEGDQTGLIRAFSDEALTARRDSVWESRKPIMVNPGDRFSEYVSAEDYPPDASIPWWVTLRKRRWMEQLAEGVAPADRAQFPVRCEIIRFDGTRCWNWAPNPKKARRCKQHLPWAAETEQRNAQIARLKLAQAAPAAADGLEELALYATSEPVKLKAITEILDRVGVRGGVEIDHHVEVEISDPAAKVREKLRLLAERASLPSLSAEIAPPEETIIDAVVVSDDES